MRSILRLAKRALLPQTVILLATFLLVMSPFNPQVTLPVLANNSIRAVIAPTPQAYRPPVIAHFSSKHAAYIQPETIQHSGSSSPREAFKPEVDCDSKPCIALSFDDGPSPETTPAVLAILEQRHVNASFFLVGSSIGGNEDIVRRMTADGFEIANHTWSHTDLTKLTADQLKDELVRTQTAIAATGAPVPKLFRPPFGAIDSNVVASAGLQTALWNEDPRDWQATDPAVLSQAILSTAKPGGIIDLHDIHPVTLDALPSVIDGLTGQGYQFVTVSQMLHSRDRPGHAPFYGYEASSFGRPH